MGQLIIRFRDNNPKKVEMELKQSLPVEVEKGLESQEAIINKIVIEKKGTSRRPKNRK